MKLYGKWPLLCLVSPILEYISQSFHNGLSNYHFLKSVDFAFFYTPLSKERHVAKEFSLVERG